jgi:hypothetical protein
MNKVNSVCRNYGLSARNPLFRLNSEYGILQFMP